DLCAHIDIQERVYVREGQIVERSHAKNPSIAHEDVEPAQLSDRLLDRGLDGGDVCAVGLDCDSLASDRPIAIAAVAKKIRMEMLGMLRSRLEAGVAKGELS